MKRLKAITKRVTSSSSHNNKQTSSPASAASLSSKRFSISSHKEIQVIRGGYNIDLSHVDSSFTKLHRSCLLNESEDKILKHLNAGIDPNQVDQVSGSAPIHLAVVNNNLSTIRVLLDHGADIDLQDGEGKTPLIKAIQCDQQQLVKYLLCNRANPNLSDTESGNSALLWALNSDMREGIQTLLLPSSNTDVNRRNVARETALHMIAKNPALNQFLDQVIDQNASLNVIDAEGRTPLMTASMFGNRDFVQILMRRGVDTHVRDATGKSAKEIAKSAGFSEIASLIEGEGLIGRSNSQKVMSKIKQPVLMSWTDSDDTDTDEDGGDKLIRRQASSSRSASNQIKLRPASATKGKVDQKENQDDDQTASLFNPVIQQLQQLQHRIPDSNVQPSNVKKSGGSIRDDDANIRVSPADQRQQQENNNSHIIGRKTSIDWAYLLKTDGKREDDPLLLASDSEDDDEEEEEEALSQDSVKESHANKQNMPPKTTRPAATGENEDFIQNLRNLLDEEIESNDDLDRLLLMHEHQLFATNEAGKEEEARKLANESERGEKEDKEKDPESAVTFQSNNPFNPFISRSQDLGVDDDEEEKLDLSSTNRQKGSVRKEEKNKNSISERRSSDGNDRRDVAKPEEDGDEEKAGFINHQTSGRSSTTTAATKQDLNEITSTRAVAGRESSLTAKKLEAKASSGESVESSHTGGADIKSAASSPASKQQLPPVKSLIQHPMLHPALLINLNPAAAVSSSLWSEDEKEEKKDGDDAEIESCYQEKGNHSSPANEKQTTKSTQSSANQPVNSNDFTEHQLHHHQDGVFQLGFSLSDDEPDDEEDEDEEWHEMQSHEHLSFNHPHHHHALRVSPALKSATSSFRPPQQEHDKSADSLKARTAASLLPSPSSPATPSATNAFTYATPVSLSLTSDASPSTASAPHPPAASSRLSTRESFDLNVRLKELESLYEKTRNELHAIKSTSHALSDDYHLMLKEKIDLEQKYYTLQSSHTKLSFECDRLRSESHRLSLDRELLSIKDQEIDSLRAERDELFDEKLLMHQKMNLIRDEVSHSLQLKADAISSESEKRLHSIMSQNDSLTHENKELKHKLLILDADLIRSKRDHETDLTLMQKEKERLMLELDSHRLRCNNNHQVNSRISDTNSELIKSVHELNSLIASMQTQQQQQFNDTMAVMKSNQFPVSHSFNEKVTGTTGPEDTDSLLMQTKDFLLNFNKELTNMRSLVKSAKDSKAMNNKIKTLKSSIDELEEKISNRTQNDLIYPHLLSKFPIEKTPRSLFVRTLMQVTNGQPFSQGNPPHVTTILNPGVNNSIIGSTSIMNANNNSGQHFNSMKGNLDKEISQLKNQLGLFCSRFKPESS